MPRKNIKYFHKHKPKKKVEKNRERIDGALFLVYVLFTFVLVIFFAAYTALNPN